MYFCAPTTATAGVPRLRPARRHVAVSAKAGGLDLGGFLQTLLPQSAGQKAGKTKAKSDLLKLVDGTQRGVKTSKAQRAEIEAAVDRLVVFSPKKTTTDRLLSGTWSLLWTSERETLFLIEKGLAFVGPTGDVLQVIDIDEGTLNNVVEFADGTAAFIVDSTVEVSSDTRVDFEFRGAGLKTPKRSFSLPPFGKGWFENVYIDEDLRISRDSRGDTLIVKRSKTPWSRDSYDA